MSKFVVYQTKQDNTKSRYKDPTHLLDQANKAKQESLQLSLDFHKLLESIDRSKVTSRDVTTLISLNTDLDSKLVETTTVI